MKLCFANESSVVYSDMIRGPASLLEGRKVLTVDGLGEGGLVSGPGRVPVAGKVPQLEVGDGEPDDTGLVQLGGNGGRQGQHLGQLIELIVLLAAARASCVPTLLFPQLEDPETNNYALSLHHITTQIHRERARLMFLKVVEDF